MAGELRGTIINNRNYKILSASSLQRSRITTIIHFMISYCVISTFILLLLAHIDHYVVCSVTNSLYYLYPPARSHTSQQGSAWAAEASSLGVPISTNFSPASFFCDAEARRKWVTAEGLCADHYSIENAVIVSAASKYSNRLPLLVDPQMQATAWLRAAARNSAATVAAAAAATSTSSGSSGAADRRHPRQAAQGSKQQSQQRANSVHSASPVLRIGDARASQKELQGILETALVTGQTLLLLNVGDSTISNPILEPILAMSGNTEGGRTAVRDSERSTSTTSPAAPLSVTRTAGEQMTQTVRLGDRSIPVHPSFKLMLCTGLSAPSFASDMSSKISIVNFNVHGPALEVQLLRELLAIEEPRLESQVSSGVYNNHRSM